MYEKRLWYQESCQTLIVHSTFLTFHQCVKDVVIRAKEKHLLTKSSYYFLLNFCVFFTYNMQCEVAPIKSENNKTCAFCFRIIDDLSNCEVPDSTLKEMVATLFIELVRLLYTNLLNYKTIFNYRKHILT